jgi:hypothetical protein
MTESTNARKPRKEPYFGLKMSIAGILIGILWVVTFNSRPPQEGSIYTQGTVVNQEIAAKGICSPIAELVVDGVAYHSRPGVGAEPCEHAIGDPIEVSYHPDDVGGTLRIPYDEKETRQVTVISLPGWILLVASVLGLVNNVRYRRSTQHSARNGGVARTEGADA